MGIGGFLAAQADRNQFLYLTRTTQARLRHSCQSELRREAHAILSPVGIDPVRFRNLLPKSETAR